MSFSMCISICTTVCQSCILLVYYILYYRLMMHGNSNIKLKYIVVFDYLSYTLCYIHNGDASTQEGYRS